MVFLIIIVVVVIAVAAYFMTRKTPALPPEEAAKPIAAESSSKPAPKADAPKADAPKADAPKADAPKADAPKADAPAAAPEADAPKAAEPVAEPVVEKAKVTSITVPLSKSSADEISTLRKGLGSVRGGFLGRLRELFGKKPAIDEDAIAELEEILLTSDVGVETTGRLIQTLRAQHQSGALGSSADLQAALRREAASILSRGAGQIAFAKKPTVVLVVGVNGVGKTTTLGKLASRLQGEGKRVLLVAGDTFRAAAVVQLEAWAKRVGCDIVKGKERAEPSGVVFDGVQKAVNEGYDVVLCDTAGRLQTKTPLMEELAKIGRSVEKALGRPADETLLVVDATTGQNAVQQAKQFGETLSLTGLVLTKLDGTAKGGVILGIVDEHKVPVRYVGLGERVEDLRVFEPEGFVEALFDGQD